MSNTFAEISQKIQDSMRIVESLLCSKLNIAQDEVSHEFAQSYATAKSQLFPHFNEYGRLEQQVSMDDIELSQNEIYDMFKDELKTICKNKNVFWMDCNSTVVFELVYKLKTNDWVQNKLPMDIAIMPRGVSVMVSRHMDNYDSETDLLFKSGTKISKVINKALQHINEKPIYTECLNIAVSKLIQQLGTLKYTVCLSINPLDYLLVSDHTTGWNSCHKWYDGAYKAGALSNMFDSVSVVAYAYRTKKDYRYMNITVPEQPVKVWRCMTYLDLEYSSGIQSRHYPSDNNIYAKIARKLATQVLISHAGVGEKHIYANLTQHHNYLYSINPIGNAYADSITAGFKIKGYGQSREIHFGSKGCCIMCGGDIDDSGKLLCNECGGIKCNICGTNCGNDFIIDGEYGIYYCNDCYIDSHVFCPRCGEHHHVDSDSYIKTVNGRTYCKCCAGYEGYYKCQDCLEWHYREDIFTDDSDCTLCKSCLENYTYCDDCDCYHLTIDMIETKEGMVCEWCLKQHYTKCGNCEQYYYTDNGCCITIDDLVS